MSPPRYERVAEQDEDDLPITSNELHHQDTVPSSPPPSFRSHVSSRRSSNQHTHRETDVEQSLDDAFGGSHEDEDENEESRRLVTESDDTSSRPPQPGNLQRRVTEFPSVSSTRPPMGGGGGSSTRDGVFANISAKPQRGEDLEEKPPTYEQAAADATPPYWETTILTPAGYSSDDIFVDGLMVGSMFSFVWNALISMSFQLIGFLLTYLLHTTHAAKHGSRAGLGITLIQYGFTMRNVKVPGLGEGVGAPEGDGGAVPPDPNDHDFDPDAVTGGGSAGMGMGGTDWLSYALMIAGWFLLIKASSDFVRARRQEQLIRNSPDRGLPVPVVGEGEGERAV